MKTDDQKIWKQRLLPEIECLKSGFFVLVHNVWLQWRTIKETQLETKLGARLWYYVESIINDKMAVKSSAVAKLPCKM